MAINNFEEYEKVLSVSWITQEKPVEELTWVTMNPKRETVGSGIDWLRRFPCVLPFSQMYPLCCIDIQNLVNQFYYFNSSDDHFQHSNVVDGEVRKVGLRAATNIRE